MKIELIHEYGSYYATVIDDPMLSCGADGETPEIALCRLISLYEFSCDSMNCREENYK